MENKSLSLIIPNYNKSVYIRDALESVLSQTRPPDEIIVVDDCSTDVSKEIIKDYVSAFPSLIKAVFFEENKGVQEARMCGVKKATGQYITFLDSDDFFYDKTKIENELKYASEYRIVYSRYCIFDNDSKEFKLPKYSRRYWQFCKQNMIYCYMHFMYMQYWPFAFIVSKKAFMEAGGYNFPVNYYEDLDLLIRCAKLGLKPKLLNRYGMAIRRNANDVEHLSNRGDLFPVAKQTLVMRYGSFVPKRSRMAHYFFAASERVFALARSATKKILHLK